MADDSSRTWKLLALGGMLYVVGFGAHSVDHIRRGYDTTPDPVVYAGYMALVVGLVAVFLAFRRHPLAPAMGVIVGLGTAIAFSAVHFPPDWGPFSEPLREGTEAVSWITLAAAIIGSAAYGVAGLRALRAGVGAREPGSAAA